MAVLVSLAAYVAVPQVARRIPQCEPSFSSEVLPGVDALTRQSLNVLADPKGTSPSGILFLGLCAVLFSIYFVVLRISAGPQSARVTALLLGAGGLFLLVLAVAPILLSSDVYFYGLYGRMLSVYDVSPYGAGIPFPKSDPFAEFLGGRYLASWYGPLWTLICAVVTRFTGEHLGITVLTFRLIGVTAALATAGLIWHCLRRMDPARATQGVVFFLWNPLVIMETGLSAHNDVVMMFFVVLAIAFHLRGWKSAAVVALTLSALVKFLTGMLIPLYICFVLRECRSWGSRLRFLSVGGCLGALVAWTMFMGARANESLPAGRAATSPEFYLNNFHELIFKGLRRALGEDDFTLRRPIYFQGWWLSAKSATEIRELDPTRPNRVLAPGSYVLVIAPQATTEARVYDPVQKTIGFVDSTKFQFSKRPPNLAEDAERARWESPIAKWPTAITANAWIRVVTWLGFALFGLLAAWRTTAISEFVVWSAAALLASYYFIITEIWPWYANWAVTLGALAPSRLPARFAMILSAAVLTLYVTISFEGSSPAWVFDLRSLPAFVLPLFIFLIVTSRRFYASWTSRNSPNVSAISGS